MPVSDSALIMAGVTKVRIILALYCALIGAPFLRSTKGRQTATVETVGNRSHWERFVIVKVDTQEAMSMYPRTMPGATLLLDRHYNSMTPYRKGEVNMYAVRKDDSCTVRYVETVDNHLILRPHNPTFPIDVVTLEHGQKPADYIVGRVCYVGVET